MRTRERFSREERVLDFAVCLRLRVVEWGGEFLGSGGEIWNCELGWVRLSYERSDRC
jgi:hypothetical protein